MEIIQKHSAGGLIINDGSVLLIHWSSPRNSYDFPKGTVETGETIEDTCLREVLEETGYNTEIIRFIDQTHYEYDWVDGTHHKKKVDYFLLRLADDKAATPKREEHETFENIWAPFSEARELLTRDIDKDLLAKALTLRDTASA